MTQDFTLSSKDSSKSDLKNMKVKTELIILCKKDTKYEQPPDKPNLKTARYARTNERLAQC